MIIKEIHIENFKCYYGSNKMEFTDKLNLIVGGNGDGKTTFFEALEWLFNVSEKSNLNTIISQKKLEELRNMEKAHVKVYMRFEHYGLKTLQKKITFWKDNQDIKFGDLHIDGTTEDNNGRVTIDGTELIKNCFDASIRQYCLFKGETDLKILNNEAALNNLVETYSNITEFEPYLKNTDHLSSEARRVYRKILESDKVSENKAKQLSSSIENNEDKLKDVLENISILEEEATRFKARIDALNKNADKSKLVKDSIERIKKLEELRIKKLSMISEKYSYRLLDESWILLAINPIIDEFNDVISTFSKNKRKIQREADKEEGKREALLSMQNTLGPTISQLPIYVPDAPTMKEMISDEHCKVCGRKAPQGSDAYKFMINKLEELQSSISEKSVNKLFPNDFSKELTKLSNIIDIKNTINIKDIIKEGLEFNIRMEKDIEALQADIDKAEKDKNEVLSQNLDADTLVNDYENLTNFMSTHSEKTFTLGRYKEQKANLENTLEELNNEFESLGSESLASVAGKINNALKKVDQAFKNAQEINVNSFIKKLEEKANSYLCKMNKEHFHGVLKIITKSNGTASFTHTDKDGKVFKANTALETTAHLAVLFAISDLTNNKKENDYPLIFDAPTSSFEASKEEDFYNLIANLNKQCIIVTKSFLKTTTDARGNKISTLNDDSIKKIKGRIFRLKLKEPFDNLNVTTISTEIEKIKF